jgi:hypothetical protein
MCNIFHLTREREINIWLEASFHMQKFCVHIMWIVSGNPKGKTYRVIKKSLCTWWLQYRKLQVIFKVSSPQTFTDTPNCVLENRIEYSTADIPNVFCDGHLQLINCVGIVRIHWVCTVIVRCTETFWSPCIIWYWTSTRLGSDTAAFPDVSYSTAFTFSAQHSKDDEGTAVKPHNIHCIYDGSSITLPSFPLSKVYTWCPRRNVPHFGRVFLMLKYTDITQNTYPKLNGYGDNGQRKVWSSGGSTHCTCQLTALPMLRRWVWYHMTAD